MAVEQKIKLKLKAFDHRILDKSAKEIVHVVKRTGANVRGPIPMPVNIERFTVNRSPHIDKESREQFEIREHYRILYIDEVQFPTIEALMKFDLPSGVEVEIETD